MLSELIDGWSEQKVIRSKFRQDVFADNRKVWFAVLIFVLEMGRAEAAIVMTSASVAPQLTGFAGRQMSIARFDPTMGTLMSVGLSLSGTGQMIQRYENEAEAGNYFRFIQSLSLVLKMPDNVTSILTVNQVESHDYSVAVPFDNVLDFGGASGGTHVYGVTASSQRVLTSAPELMAFTGSGMANLFLSASTGTYIYEQQGNALMGVRTLAGADLAITYNYIPVPEPRAMGLAGGLILLAPVSWRLFRAHRRSRCG
ncbi:MAG: choice-of-anchor E domain-containing protein [Akkermansiaceae bacterium]|nr:choice-of-anchor E domain-containing protein [Verrucomicrobiales bacterium]